MAADTGVTAYAGDDDLNLPSDPSHTAPTAAGDGHFTFFQFLERVTGFIRAIYADYTLSHKPNVNAHHNRQHDLASGSDHTVTADLPMGGHKITGLATPTAGTDAATKAYADALAAGLTPKFSVKAATSTNQGALSGLAIIDGYQTVDGDRILLIGQSTASQNGIWVTHSGAWTRPTDFATGADETGAWVFVEGGTAEPTGNKGTDFGLTGTGPITVDTTAQTWTQIFGQVADGAISTAKLAAGAVTDTTTAAANKDGTSGTPSMRTLGAGAQQAAAGNDSRLSDARTPTAHHTTHQPSGTDALDLTTMMRFGTLAARPAASAALEGIYYFASDSGGGTVYQVQSAAWVQVSKGLTASPAAHDLRGALHTDQLRPTGIITETVPRDVPLAAVGAVVSGTVTFQAVYLPAGMVTSITYFSGSTALTRGSNADSHLWFVLCDSSLVQLRATADDTSSAWAANSAHLLNLSSTYTIVTPGWYYLGLMCAQGTGGAPAVPNLLAMSSSSVILSLAPNRSLRGDASLTVPKSDGFGFAVGASNGNIPYGQAS